MLSMKLARLICSEREMQNVKYVLCAFRQRPPIVQEPSLLAILAIASTPQILRVHIRHVVSTVHVLVALRPVRSPQLLRRTTLFRTTSNRQLVQFIRSRFPATSHARQHQRPVLSHNPTATILTNATTLRLVRLPWHHVQQHDHNQQQQQQIASPPATTTTLPADAVPTNAARLEATQTAAAHGLQRPAAAPQTTNVVGQQQQRPERTAAQVHGRQTGRHEKDSVLA